jgi:hypothetical protein
MGQTFTARQTARAISAKLGRDVSDKRVRAWVRDNVPAYDDDGYTPHAYDARLRDRIVAAFVTRSKAGRTVAAQTGRAKSPAKSPATAKSPKTTARAPKAVTVAPSAPQAES